MTPAELLELVRNRGREMTNREYITLLEDMLYQSAKRQYEMESRGEAGVLHQSADGEYV